MGGPLDRAEKNAGRKPISHFGVTVQRFRLRKSGSIIDIQMSMTDGRVAARAGLLRFDLYHADLRESAGPARVDCGSAEG